MPRDWWHFCLLHIRNILKEPLFDNFSLAKLNSHTNYQVITIYNVEAHSCFYKWQPWEEPGFVMCQLWNLYGGSGGRSFKHSQLSDTKCQSLLLEILEFPPWCGKSFQKTLDFLPSDVIIIFSSTSSYIIFFIVSLLNQYDLISVER